MFKEVKNCSYSFKSNKNYSDQNSFDKHDHVKVLDQMNDCDNWSNRDVDGFP